MQPYNQIIWRVASAAPRGVAQYEGGPSQNPLPFPFVFFASSVVNAGSSGTDTQDSAGELQLAKKTLHSETHLTDPATAEDITSISDKPKASNPEKGDADSTSSSSRSTASDSSTSLGEDAHQKGGAEPTSTSAGSDNASASQDSSKPPDHNYMASRADAESQHALAGIPAAHQLRALSAGECFSCHMAVRCLPSALFRATYQATSQSGLLSFWWLHTQALLSPHGIACLATTSRSSLCTWLDHTGSVSQGGIAGLVLLRHEQAPDACQPSSCH